MSGPDALHRETLLWCAERAEARASGKDQRSFALRGIAKVYREHAEALAAPPAAADLVRDAWISVDERLPSDGAHVWIASWCGVEKARFTVEGSEFLVDAIHDMSEAQSGVTHWMPYVEPSLPALQSTKDRT